MYTWSPESNFHLPRCVDHSLECFTDSLSADHQTWILKGYNTDTLHPIGLRWKAKQFSTTKSKFVNHDARKLPEDICPHCCFASKECHVHVFAKYCKEQINKIFAKYPKAMEPMMVKKVYCLIYNSALHYYNYCHFNTMTHMTLHLPPDCLCEEMKQLISVVNIWNSLLRKI